MKKIVIITDIWDCPYFVDGFHKVNVALPRFGCKLTGKACNMVCCPLGDYIDEEDQS